MTTTNSAQPDHKNTVQAVLYRAGEQRLEGDTEGMPDTEIRREGVKRWGKTLGAAAVLSTVATLFAAGDIHLPHDGSTTVETPAMIMKAAKQPLYGDPHSPKLPPIGAKH